MEIARIQRKQKWTSWYLKVNILNEINPPLESLPLVPSSVFSLSGPWPVRLMNYIRSEQKRFRPGSEHLRRSRFFHEQKKEKSRVPKCLIIALLFNPLRFSLSFALSLSHTLSSSPSSTSRTFIVRRKQILNRVEAKGVKKLFFFD